MKKLLGTLALTAVAASAFAQGTVTFGNQTGLVKQWTSTDNTVLISSAKGNANVELIAAATGVALAHPLFTATTGGTSPNYTTLASFLSANPGWALGSGTSNPGGLSVSGIFANGTVTIANIAEAASAQYFVIGWTGVGSLDNALASGSPFQGGASAIFTTATGDPLATPPGAPVNTKTTFGGLTMAPIVVPEPTSFALAGLGLAALLVFRRRS